MSSRTDYLQLFYNSTFLPIHYYKDSECLLSLPAVSRDFDLTEMFRIPLLDRETELDYVVSGEFLHYGLVRDFEKNEYIIAGPVPMTRVRRQDLSRILLESSVSFSYREQVENFLQVIPLFSFDQFINLLALLYYELHHKLISPLKYFQNVQAESIQQIDEKHLSDSYHAREEERFHNTYQFEQEFYHYVENGDVAGLERLYSGVPKLSAGAIGKNSLRQEKNIFIASITLLTRHSIAGGLDIETAYQLSDTYIKMSEKAQTVDEVSRLSSAAPMDFTRRVAACKVPGGMSSDVYRCIQYISTHTNQSLSVSDVANAVGKSRSHISRQFKQELGFNLSDFIMRRKLEEGKSLLTFTDKSISEISEYLCFSSQAYFQNVFKKKYGMTPLEYRKANRR